MYVWLGIEHKLTCLINTGLWIKIIFFVDFFHDEELEDDDISSATKILDLSENLKFLNL